MQRFWASTHRYLTRKNPGNCLVKISPTTTLLLGARMGRDRHHSILAEELFTSGEAEKLKIFGRFWGHIGWFCVDFLLSKDWNCEVFEKSKRIPGPSIFSKKIWRLSLRSQTKQRHHDSVTQHPNLQASNFPYKVYIAPDLPASFNVRSSTTPLQWIQLPTFHPQKKAPGFDSCHSFLDASVSPPLSCRQHWQHGVVLFRELGSCTSCVTCAWRPSSCRCFRTTQGHRPSMHFEAFGCRFFVHPRMDMQHPTWRADVPTGDSKGVKPNQISLEKIGFHDETRQQTGKTCHSW